MKNKLFISKVLASLLKSISTWTFILEKHFWNFVIFSHLNKMRFYDSDCLRLMKITAVCALHSKSELAS